MKPTEAINGHDLREMFTAATHWLEGIVPDINALNVYPVPDGDCGTNMLFTMRASLAEASHCTDDAISSVAQAMAKGALMGARGNSGVILSQIWRGLAGSLREKETINGNDLAAALREASKTAYQALSNPVEGTILTVISDAASAASKRAAGKDDNLMAVLETALGAARESVAETPNLLSVLKEAGVVDAGGHGLYTLLEGALLYLKGDMDNRCPQLVASRLPLVPRPAEISVEEESYGFCTQFLVKGQGLDTGKLREKLQDLGKSLMVVGDSATVRVHVHTLDPDRVTEVASDFGSLFDNDIRNMDKQHKDFLLLHQGKMTKGGTAIVAVVNGDGLASVFSNLGVSAIVPGGQTMNPSIIDILQAVEAVPSDNVIILPNNKNIALAAQQVQSLTQKNTKVIPTETMPQGISALVAFTPESDFETNAEQMAEARTEVKTLEITRASRATKLNGLAISKGQAIGLLDGKLLAAGDKADDVIFDLLPRIGLNGVSVITLYYGHDTSQVEANQVGTEIRQRYPAIEVEVVNGGQPHYNYIISVE